jgi:hypothetical protein
MYFHFLALYLRSAGISNLWLTDEQRRKLQLNAFRYNVQNIFKFIITSSLPLFQWGFFWNAKGLWKLHYYREYVRKYTHRTSNLDRSSQRICNRKNLLAWATTSKLTKYVENYSTLTTCIFLTSFNQLRRNSSQFPRSMQAKANLGPQGPIQTLPSVQTSKEQQIPRQKQFIVPVRNI